MSFLKAAASACLLALAIGPGCAWCQNPAITVDVAHPGAKISPTLYGVFFEEINHAGDGGIYAELINNRSFEERTTLDWSLQTAGSTRAGMALDTAKPLNEANKTSLRVDIARVGQGGSVAVINDGYWGIALQKGAKYNLSFFARAANFNGAIVARLEGPDGKVYGSQTITGIGAEWKRYTASLESTGTEPNARFALVASNPGTLWFDVVSLFPAKTWKGRPNGMRPDVAEMLAQLKPGFLRFPGGCYVEGGNYLRNAFRWKTTIGDNAERPGHLNDMWSYYSSDGLGFHEYLQLAEDLGAEPLYTVNVGMAHRESEPMSSMNSWLQDALDAIEYANGPVTSTWGALRAKNGHPEPFHLKYVEIGNENGGPNYEARYPLFYNAIKAKYPDMILIANTLVKSPMDIVDNHIYSSPDQMREVANTYDSWDRTGKPKVFVGEYANNSGVGNGNLSGALSEAAYMIGFEHNADVVQMTSYAPLLYNKNDYKWQVNLIGYDSSRVYGSPSYWAQWMFANNRGDVVLPLKLQAATKEKVIPFDRGGIALETRNGPAEFKDVKVTSGSQVLYASDFARNAAGVQTFNGSWQVEDGVYQQTASDWLTVAGIGNDDWRDYSVSLKLRRPSGEGSVAIAIRNSKRIGYGGAVTLSFGVPGRSLASLGYWNLTGTKSLGRAAGSFENGRWYDVRIDVAGAHAQVWIDGQPVIDAPNIYHEFELSPMEASASLSEKTGEIVLKVVNFTEQPQSASIRLDGAPKIESKGTEIVLTSASTEDENTLDQPRKVEPVTRAASGFAPEFTRTFAPRSLTVLRLKIAQPITAANP
jgi:alpha-L-arabinofuranosidase